MENESAKLLFSLQSPVDFGCFPTKGFLPTWSRKPTVGVWDEVGVLLPQILVSGRVRTFIDKLPPFPLDVLMIENQRGWWVAFRNLSFIAHAYVWGEPTKIKAIPEAIAAPWYKIADHLQVPPSLSYASYALHNWRLLDDSKPIGLDNIGIYSAFDGGSDELWFIIIHIIIEAFAGKAIHALWLANKAICDDSAQFSEFDVYNCLVTAREVIAKMTGVLARMPEKCDPYIYYNRARPFIHGWKNNPMYPEGMVYEGCYSNQPQKFNGETGAQSSVIPAIDAFLDVEHDEKSALGVYLKDMRQFMPPKHREFLSVLEQHKTFLRTYVLAHPNLWGVYDGCLKALHSFRMLHLSLADKYIANQSPRGEANSTTVGTGGTPFSSYLKAHADDTLKALLII